MDQQAVRSRPDQQAKQASQGNQVANLLQAGWMDCGNPPNQPTKRKTMPPFFILPLMIFLSSFSTSFRDGIHSCVCAYPCMCIWSFPSWSLLYLFPVLSPFFSPLLFINTYENHYPTFYELMWLCSGSLFFSFNFRFIYVANSFPYLFIPPPLFLFLESFALFFFFFSFS